jgi:hypothetical protein
MTGAAEDFRLSRVYAQGWNAARAGTVSGRVPANPYASEPEKSRWQAGYTGAQAEAGKTRP